MIFGTVDIVPGIILFSSELRLGKQPQQELTPMIQAPNLVLEMMKLPRIGKRTFL